MAAARRRHSNGAGFSLIAHTSTDTWATCTLTLRLTPVPGPYGGGQPAAPLTSGGEQYLGRSVINPHAAREPSPIASNGTGYGLIAHTSTELLGYVQARYWVAIPRSKCDKSSRCPRTLANSQQWHGLWPHRSHFDRTPGLRAGAVLGSNTSVEV